jgi:hypothetical protein
MLPYRSRTRRKPVASVYNLVPSIIGAKLLDQ